MLGRGRVAFAAPNGLTCLGFSAWVAALVALLRLREAARLRSAGASSSGSASASLRTSCARTRSSSATLRRRGPACLEGLEGAGIRPGLRAWISKSVCSRAAICPRSSLRRSAARAADGAVAPSGGSVEPAVAPAGAPARGGAARWHSPRAPARGGAARLSRTGPPPPRAGRRRSCAPGGRRRPRSALPLRAPGRRSRRTCRCPVCCRSIPPAPAVGTRRGRCSRLSPPAPRALAARAAVVPGPGARRRSAPAAPTRAAPRSEPRLRG